VREALFSMLGELDGERVLDLFAGTGALGIEALSRGAGAAVFVERDSGAAGVLSENLSLLGIDRRDVRVLRADAHDALRSALRSQETYHLIFIDPPYSQTGEWGAKLSEALPRLLEPKGRIVVESDRRAPLELDLPVFRERRYGDTSITIHTSTCPDQQAP
jgi:16S rRNA (guanine966-N2)-methyltransferase